ncbi:hypothetical protein [Candidatus Viridilinea mediisalina]|uniref:Uncharacterized protein n=1 Tax=Candidatus Viridilinea mediisalina TaxID=2024553 RepID=A0A2A6RJQ2_9CHLR|nr:hypothetical protein [Candidatus Viridilinea mediisalina]PDW03242.1 hypothetical protein CJ255_09945 [Candidatus Viridilinea mediisalina]
MAPPLLPDDDPLLIEFARELASARATSYPLLLASYCCTTPNPAEATATLDAVAAAVGYQGLGAGWIAVPRRIAAKLLTQIIASELAYPTEVLPREQAEALAGRFLGRFAQNARYYTNGAISGEFAVYDAQGNEVLGWRSLSSAPFDNGVVALDQQRVALLWAEDAP